MSNSLLLLNRRAAMFSDAEGKLPYDAEIEYLECTGTQYVNSGFFGDNNTRMDFSFSTTNTTTQVMAGSRGTNSNSLSIGGKAAGSGTERYGSASYSLTIISGEQLSISMRPDGFYLDDTLKSEWSPSSFTTPNALWFGRANTNNTGLIGKIYSAKVYKDGEMKFDGIPVRVGTTGYMYDRVSGVLFENVGTDNFGLGPDVTQ